MTPGEMPESSRAGDADDVLKTAAAIPKLDAESAVLLIVVVPAEIPAR